MNKNNNRPISRQQLLARVDALAGFRIGEIAQQLGETVPANLLREKGWVGQLIEKALGCEAGSKPMADFPELEIELKTLPLNKHFRVKESTFVCVVPLKDLTQVTFENSVLWDKMKQVLWLPIESEQQIPLAERRILGPLLWRPNSQEYQQIKTDFDHHMELIALGQIDSITAHAGEVLQIRPKAANAKQLTTAIGPDGDLIQTLPRGFYLRSCFTQAIIDTHYQ